ncbi:MAG: response regulator transcription factor [Terracidiphilus sp.]|jgi:DNA-binding NarL/FixJ family response regulator
MMNILITDDHPNVRRGLRELLLDSFPGSLFFEACNGDEVSAQFLLAPPDLMLLDINMPGRSGFEVLKDVRKSFPVLPIIMVSVQPESQYALRCLQAGATAYISKSSASEDLVPAIKKILENAVRLARNPLLN